VIWDSFWNRFSNYFFSANEWEAAAGWLFVFGIIFFLGNEWVASGLWLVDGG
jgi:hypothetical protein